MIQRKTFMTGMALALIAAPGLRAQPSAAMSRIGLLRPFDTLTPQEAQRQAALRAGLRELGWIEGKNLVIDIRYAGVNPQRQRELAAELKALPVALILASGTITIRAARDGAPGVPIVMINAADPIGAGLVASLARPGGLLTGTSAAGDEVLPKQLELLAAAVPQLKRVSVLMNSANPANKLFFDALAARASTLGVALERVTVSSVGELDGAIARAKGGALLVLGDPMFGQNLPHVVELTQRHKVPAIFGGRAYVAAGGLMSYLSAEAWHFRSAAGYVDKLLKGAKPADLPVMQPTEFELVINLGTARALGLTLPPSLLLRAAEVIQ